MQRILGLAAVLVVLAGSAMAKDYTLAGLTIAQPWTRVTPGAIKTGSAYLSVTNTGGAMDRLVGASSPAAERAELHNHEMEGNIARMRPVTAIDLPPGKTAELKPGGLHIMLIGLKEPIRMGKPVPLTLRFEKAGTVEVELAVESAGATAPDHRGHGAGGH